MKNMLLYYMLYVVQLQLMYFLRVEESCSEMSNEEADDERKLYRCAKKYEQIVKQFDELIEMMNNRTKRPPKRRKLSSSGGGSSNAIEADDNEVYVQTITKFLDTLQPKTDASCSKNTGTPK